MILTNLFCIIDNTALQVKYMIETVMQHVGARLLATDATRAIHDNVLVFMLLHHFNRHR